MIFDVACTTLFSCFSSSAVTFPNALHSCFFRSCRCCHPELYFCVHNIQGSTCLLQKSTITSLVLPTLASRMDPLHHSTRDGIFQTLGYCHCILYVSLELYGTSTNVLYPIINTVAGILSRACRWPFT